MKEYHLTITGRIHPISNIYIELSEQTEKYYTDDALEERIKFLRQNNYFYHVVLEENSIIEGKCIVCGKDIVGKSTKKTCSTNCRSKLYYRIKHSLPIEDKVKPITMTEEEILQSAAWEEEMNRIGNLIRGNFFEKKEGENYD